MIAERKRGVAAHRKAEPSGQCDGRRKATPLRKNLENAVSSPTHERDYRLTNGTRIGRYCTGSRDDPLKTGRRPLGSNKRVGRAHICRGLRIGGEQGGDALPLLDIEEPIAIGGKVEVVEYPELGMEAIWRIEVVDFPAFIVIDDKGNDFFAGLA